MWRDDDRDTCLLCFEDLNDVDDMFCKAECKQEYFNRYGDYLKIC